MRHTYIVWPSGVGFDTSNLGVTIMDAYHAYRKAHRYAAEQAAHLGVPHFVTRHDTGAQRYGFGDWHSPILQFIMRLGLGSYWSFEDEEWKPQPPETTEDKELVEIFVRQ